MFLSHLAAFRAALRLFALAASFLVAAAHAQAQTPSPSGGGGAVYGPAPASSPAFHVSGPAQRLEMIVNTSRIVTLDYDVPRLLVENPELITATPLKSNQLQISARKPGVTALTVFDPQGSVHSIDIHVYGDARELQSLLEGEFPEVSGLRVRPTSSSVIISGHVPRPDTVSRIVRMAEDYYPKVINNMNVGGAQTVLLHVKVMEVSRTKLRRCGIDWAALTGNDFIIQSVSGMLAAAGTQGGALTGAGDTVRFGILDGGNTFGMFLDLLKQNNLAKLLAEPTLVTTSGRPAVFNSGGEIPVPVPAGLGVVSIQYREFGTRVDFVPIVLGNGMIRLEVRPHITDIDPSLAVAGAPGFRQRMVDTGVEMRAGQTLALAGLIQNRQDSEVRGIPWLADLPWAGTFFRRTTHTMNEVELLIMVTPELVEAMEPHEVPPCGPGMSGVVPTDVQLHWKGHIEMPGGCDNCFHGIPGPAGPFGPGVPFEDVPAPRGASKKPAHTSPKMLASGGSITPKKAVSRASATESSRKASPRDTNVKPAASLVPTNPTGHNIPETPYPRKNPARSNADNLYGPNKMEPGFIGPLGYDVTK